MDELPHGIGPVPAPDPLAETDARVADDLECMQCGYNLRTLPVDGLCPECAAPVRFSREGYYLRNTPVEWLRKLKWGLSLIIVSILLSILAWAGLVVYTAYTSVRAPAIPLAGMNHSLGVMATCAFLPLGVMLLIGVAKLTSKQPADDEFRPRGERVRVWARRTLVVYFLLYVAGFALGGFATRVEAGVYDSVIGMIFSILIAIMNYLVSIVLLLLVVKLMWNLMRRIPRTGIAKFANVVFWGCLLSIGPAAFGMILAVTTMASIPAPTPLVTTLPAVATTMPAATMPAQGPTTFPASAPAPMGAPFPQMGSVFLTGCGICSFGGFAIAAFILLFPVRGALKRVIMEIERSPDGGAEAGGGLIGEYGAE